MLDERIVALGHHLEAGPALRLVAATCQPLDPARIVSGRLHHGMLASIGRRVNRSMVLQMRPVLARKPFAKFRARKAGMQVAAAASSEGRSVPAPARRALGGIQL